MNDELGKRIKEQYENRTRYFVPRRTFTILRLDGKAFHTYTRGLERPFDKGLSEDMDAAIIAMLPEIQGAVFAYTQSDEISILVTDFEKPTTSAWFDGNIQKMASVSASIMTAEFNDVRRKRQDAKLRAETFAAQYPADGQAARSYIPHGLFQLAYFDCRVFTIPDRIEVMNYFRWRQQDCVRNSVSMVAQSNFSHKKLHGKSQSDMHEMLHQIGVNWATDFSDAEKNGRIILKEEYEVDPGKYPNVELRSMDKDGNVIESVPIPLYRTRWVSKGAWVFTKDEGKLLEMIPQYE